MKLPTKKKPLKSKLDSVFSEYIRRSYADKRGYVKCVSCGCKKYWKQMQAGHYVRRSHIALRWSEDNVFPQCAGCNVFKGGNYPEYTGWLLKNKGEEHIKKLLTLSKTICKMSISEMYDLLQLYRSKVEELDHN